MSPHDWYAIEIHHQAHLTGLTPEQATDLQARGLWPEPATAPAHLAERIGALLAGLCQLSS